ncbi:nuclear transport factor 2 family protein [Aestuariirhabdus sp. LZHN29]|uniref:nuclear transport factor 2 family protein n=1 Tax=Aestuariirhabdus sp. LZHN29 TaxID=3417462 RepID=UPI003CF7A6EA
MSKLQQSDRAEQAINTIKAFLEASMKPDPELAATFMAPDVKITFTGGRLMENAYAITAFNGGRYKWVKKALGQFDASLNEGYVTVYSNGTLYGEWLDGRPFANNRYLDRFDIRDGKITRMDVWNDSAEWILTPEINQTP